MRRKERALRAGRACNDIIIIILVVYYYVVVVVVKVEISMLVVIYASDIVYCRIR